MKNKTPIEVMWTTAYFSTVVGIYLLELILFSFPTSQWVTILGDSNLWSAALLAPPLAAIPLSLIGTFFLTVFDGD